ncbi:MAG: GNAT family N-acetyltransferase [Acidobacteriia bacterium]|nr:GNAT family N-acetyltransferase [Terriglobia bacterium]
MPARREPKSSPISLRDYRSDDFRRLWEIDQQCFAGGIAYSQCELAHYIALPGAFAIVAESAGSGMKESGAGKRRIVGFLVGQRLPRGLGHIVTIDVVPEARRAGVGSLLMDECEQRLRNAGCTSIYLETAVDNNTALRFYKARDYSVLKTIPRYYLDKLDALLMGKKL